MDEASRPAVEVSVVVRLPTQAQVEGIADPAQVRLVGAIDVGGDERDPVRGQAAEDLVVSPARVRELERETDRSRPRLQEPSEGAVVPLDGRGDRQQDQAEPPAEGLDRAGQPRDGRDRVVAAERAPGSTSLSLRAEAEMLGRRGHPGCHRGRRRPPVERVVELDRVETARICPEQRGLAGPGG